MPERIKSVSKLIRKIVSEIILKELKDPRIKGFLTVTDVVVSKDLRTAKVFVSLLNGTEEQEEELLRGLNSAAPFIQRRVRQEVTLKRIPEIIFMIDDSIERGVRVCSIIDKAIEEDQKAAGHDETTCSD